MQDLIRPMSAARTTWKIAGVRPAEIRRHWKSLVAVTAIAMLSAVPAVGLPPANVGALDDENCAGTWIRGVGPGRDHLELCSGDLEVDADQPRGEREPERNSSIVVLVSGSTGPASERAGATACLDLSKPIPRQSITVGGTASAHIQGNPATLTPYHVVIDWGDGTRNTYDGSYGFSHSYARTGHYSAVFSDSGRRGIGGTYTDCSDTFSFGIDVLPSKPKVRVMLGIWIPGNYVAAPLPPCQDRTWSGPDEPRANNGSAPVRRWRYFRGDDRGPSASWGASVRAGTLADLDLDPRRLSGSAIVETAARTGQTKLYADDALSPLIRRLSDFADDGVLDDCHLLDGVGQASTLGFHVLAAKTAETSAHIHLWGSATNPLVPLAPAIDWDIDITVDVSTTRPTYAVSARHDAFPAYELYLGAWATSFAEPYQLIHQYDPGPFPYSFQQVGGLYSMSVTDEHEGSIG